jgi:hypothetical protein
MADEIQDGDTEAHYYSRNKNKIEGWDSIMRSFKTCIPHKLSFGGYKLEE